MVNNLKVALFQTDIIWEDAAATVASIERGVYSYCNEHKPDLIVFPETFSVGFSMNPDISETCDGVSVSWLRKVSRELSAAVIASVPIIEGELRYNRCFFIAPDGLLHHYDKRHLFNYSGEGDTYVPGREKRVVCYKGWSIMLNVCYDLRFPVWSRNVGNGYDLLVNIANWPDTRIEAATSLIRSRAIENCSYALFCNRVGDDPMCHYNGMSTIIDYFGNTIAESEECCGIKVFSAELSRKDLDHYRNRFPAWKDADKFNIEL